MPKWKVGDVVRFKAVWAIAEYGPTATVVRAQDVFTGSHPGHVHKTLLDLETATGQKLQWPASLVSSRCARVSE